jgi:hypothetical protein
MIYPDIYDFNAMYVYVEAQCTRKSGEALYYSASSIKSKPSVLIGFSGANLP